MAPWLAAMWLVAGTAQADQNVQVHGFLSQAAVHTDANNVGGSSEDGVGLDLRELGVNASYRPNGDWLLSAQALARWAGDSDEGDARLDYAFVDRTLSSDASHRVDVQVGKVKNPYGLYNTTRDVAHTRPGVLMPQSIYLDQVRNFFLASPGVSFTGDVYRGEDVMNWTLNFMRPEVDDEAMTAFMVTQQPGHFEGRNSWLGQWLWEHDGARWRAGLTLGSVAMKYHPTPTEFLQPGRIRLNTGVLSLQHNRENVVLTAEYALVRQLRNGFGVPALDLDTTVEAAYVQGEWRFRPAWRAYARYEELYLDRDDRDGEGFSALSGLPAIQRYAKDAVLGVRFDATPGWALSAELHQVNGTAWLPRLDNPAAQMQKHWHMLLLQAAYRF
ncbi:MAG: hypothetical protein AB1831_09250 [Pseudomonadota bacterium]